MKSPLFYVQNLVRWMGFGGSAQYSGEQRSEPQTAPAGSPVNVTEDVAMTLSAVFACVRILVDTVAGIPIHHYRMKKGEFVLDDEDELAQLLTLRPNSHMTAEDFWAAVLFNLVLRGNGYALIARNTLGQPIGLFPLAAAQIQPLVLKDGTGWYLYTLDGEQIMIAEEDMLHFRIFGNGRIGLSPLAYGARTIGIAAAADIYAGTFFSRGGKPGGILRIDRILTPKQREEVRASFKEVHEGADSAHRLFVLEAGMQYQQVQLDPSSLQMIETRKFNVKDIARFFGVPAFLINESEGSTSWGTGLEQQMLGFYGLTVRPYTQRIAATLRQRLIPLAEQHKRKVAYDFDELLGVDSRAKAEYYTKLVANGIMTRNEVRGRLLLPASTEKHADELTTQSAMVPLAKLGEQPKAPAAPPGELGDNEDDKEGLPALKAWGIQPHTKEAKLPIALNVHVGDVQNTTSHPNIIVQPASPTVIVEAAAPQVTVEPAVVNVAAPEVTVENVVQPAEVVLPTRKTVTVVERDDQDRIKKTTSTETNV